MNLDGFTAVQLGTIKGIKGDTPSVEMTATALAPGEPATVERTGTDLHPTFHLGVPAGLPAAGAVQEDEATAAHILAPYSKTSQALATTFAPQAVVNEGPGDALAALQAAVDSDKGVYLRKGVHELSGSLRVGDGVRLEGDVGASLKLAAGANEPLVTNKNYQEGNRGIVIDGLAFDGNRDGQTTDVTVLDFTRVSESVFDNLDVQGGRRHNMFPTGTDGEGLVLRYGQQNEIRGGHYHDNDYDGIKLRGTHFNRIDSPLMTDNGRSGIQISFNSPSGPPWNQGEGVDSEGSSHNVIVNPVVRHSTGIANVAAPSTCGIYIHTGSRNTVIGLQAHGTQQGIGLFGGTLDNEFLGGLLRTRGSDVPAISIDESIGLQQRNRFVAITTRALEGANGRMVNVGEGSLNQFIACYFGRGDGTGVWTIEVAASAGGTHFLDCFTDGQLVDASSSTVWNGPDPDGAFNLTQLGITRFRNRVGAAPEAPSVGALEYASSNVKRWLLPGGFDASLGSGGFRIGDGGSLPVPGSGYRGQIRHAFGSDGTADRSYICRKRADGSYEWSALN